MWIFPPNSSPGDGDMSFDDIKLPSPIQPTETLTIPLPCTQVGLEPGTLHSKATMALFETAASGLDSAQASLDQPVVLTICAWFVYHRRSGLQTRERSLKSNPKPKLWF